MALRIVLILDLAAENPLSIDEIATQMGAGPIPRVLRVSDFGVTPTQRGSSVDWPLASRAIVRMVAAARRLQESEQAAEFYVCGRAGLPLFAQLGLELSKWAAVIFLNRRPDATWDRFVLGATQAVPPLLEVRLPTIPSEASGRVAVAITVGQRIDDSQIRAFSELQGAALAGIIHATGPALLEPAQSGGLAQELVNLFGDVKKQFPHVAGLTLHIAGPAPLAFLAGRAINPNIFPDAWLPNFEQGKYVPAVALPIAQPSRALQPETDEVKAERSRILARFVASIRSLKQQISIACLPPFLEENEALLFVEHVKAIALGNEPEGDAFELSIAERRMGIGRGLLDALMGLADETLDRIARLLYLHEVYHSRQNVQSSTYSGIGRAGLAIEEIDFWADCVALWVAIELELDAGGQAARSNVPTIAREYFQAALDGIAAFDRAEHGARIYDLAERRLRRYLIWTLEFVRVLSIKTIEDLRAILSARLIVEIAPIRGALDSRFDKQVLEVANDAELFVVLERRLLRIQQRAALNPKAMVEAVRTYDIKGLLGAMRAVRDENTTHLAPWVARISTV